MCDLRTARVVVSARSTCSSSVVLHEHMQRPILLAALCISCAHHQHVVRKHELELIISNYNYYAAFIRKVCRLRGCFVRVYSVTY